MPIALACRPNTTSIVLVSGMPVERRQIARMPCGPNSADSARESASIAAHAGPMPPTSGAPSRAGSGVCIRITPDRFSTMRRPAALAVRKCARAYVAIGKQEAFRGEFGERYSLNAFLRNADGVEGDIDASGLPDHGAEVFLDRLLVQRIDLGALGAAAGSDDVARDGVDRGKVAPGQEDRRPFAGKGAGDRAADGASGSVDDGGFVLKQHVPYSCCDPRDRDGPGQKDS